MNRLLPHRSLALFCLILATLSSLASAAPAVPYELTPQEAIRRAKLHLMNYADLCVLRNPSGQELEESFLTLFDNNARVLDDLTNSNEVVTPSSYVQIFREHFPAPDRLEVDIEVKEDIIEATYVPSGEFFEVALTFKKTLSDHVVNGYRANETKDVFQRAFINVSKNPDIPVKIMRIELFATETNTEFGCGLSGHYRTADGQFNLLSPAGGFEDQLDVSVGAYLRCAFNPLSPAHFTQRHNLRFLVGVEIQLARGSHAADALATDELNGELTTLSPGLAVDANGQPSNLAQPNAQPLRGHFQSTLTDVNIEEEQWIASPLIGLNWLFYKRGDKQAFLNVGAMPRFRISGTSTTEGLCTERYMLADDPANDLDDDVAFQPASGQLYAYEHCEGGAFSQTTSFSQTMMSTALLINPTYTWPLGKQARLALGLDVRVDVGGYTSSTMEPFTGRPTLHTTQPWSDLFSSDRRITQAGLTAGLLF